MVEKRKHQRYDFAGEVKSHVLCSGVKEEAQVLNVSLGGMKVFLSRPADAGAKVFSKINILPDSGPFFIRGKVIRAVEKEGKWETAVSFEKVSTMPFMIMNMYQMA